MNDSMHLFLFLLTVKAYSQFTLASGFDIRLPGNNDPMAVTTIDIMNKTYELKTSRMVRKFCKLFPYYKGCRTDDNPSTTTFNSIPTINIETNTNSTFVKFGNETTDCNVSNHKSTYFIASSTETSPTTTIINNWTTRDDESIELITINTASETTLNDDENLTTLPTKDYTDDEVRIPTTLESTTNYEPNITASVTTKVFDNVTLIDTPTTEVSTSYTNSTIDSIDFATTTEALDNVTIIETTASVFTDYTNSKIDSTEFPTTTEVLDNVTIIETPISAVSTTGYTNSTIGSIEFVTTTEPLDNVTLIGTTTEVSTLYTDIYHKISLIIKNIIKYFNTYFKLNDI